MTKKLKKLARDLSEKSGMSYQSAVNALFTSRDARVLSALLADTDGLREEELHERILACMVPTVLKAHDIGNGSGLEEPVVLVFIDDEVEYPTGEKEEVTVGGETVLATVVERGPSRSERHIDDVGGTLVARNEADGHVMGAAVLPRAALLRVLQDGYGWHELPVFPGKITVCVLSILATDPIIKGYSPNELRELMAKASQPTN